MSEIKSQEDLDFIGMRKDKKHPHWEFIIEFYKTMLAVEMRNSLAAEGIKLDDTAALWRIVNCMRTILR
jgi:hypothetical protein